MSAGTGVSVLPKVLPGYWTSIALENRTIHVLYVGRKYLPRNLYITIRICVWIVDFTLLLIFHCFLPSRVIRWFTVCKLSACTASIFALQKDLNLVFVVVIPLINPQT